MATPTKKFRQALDQFIANVMSWGTPEQQKELQKVNFKLSAAFKINAKGAIGLFVEGILPYARNVFMNDWDYFLSNHIKVDQEFNQLQEKIKQWWPQFTDEQQNSAAMSLKLLIMYGAIALRNEQLRAIINEFRDVDNPLVF
jgi:hypothetical protein